MAISEDRSSFGWPQGCPAAVGASSVSAVLLNVTGSHLLSSSSFGSQLLTYISMCLILGVYTGIKDSMQEFKMF